MTSKKLNSGPAGDVFALVFQQGDQVMAALKKFAASNKLSAASFTAIGAFSDLTLGWFDWETKDYRKIAIGEQVEVLTLAGDVSLKPDGTPQVHAHVVVGKSDGTAHGGHLME